MKVRVRVRIRARINVRVGVRVSNRARRPRGVLYIGVLSIANEVMLVTYIRRDSGSMVVSTGLVPQGQT